MLNVENVSKHFGPTPALQPTTLHIQAGKTTVLIGPSGCGKSTLLRLIAGLITPDAGAVRVDDTAVSPETAMTVRRRMGYVIQDGGLFPHLTARDNILLMARYLKTDKAAGENRLNELTGLTHFPPDGLDRYPAQLSGGQRQRVSLMRALMLDPDVLLMDEPLAALDPMIRIDLQEDLADVFKQLGKTVLMVTHDLAEAAFFAHTIVLMRDGRIVQQGTLADLTDRPADDFVTRFITAQRTAWEPPATRAKE